MFIKEELPKQTIKKIEWIILAIIFGAAVLSFLGARVLASSDGNLRVYFLDVGQGDAEFIQAPNGNQVLIDGGPDASILNRLGEVMPINDHTIDVLILSHPHTDHVVGLNEVLKRYQVSYILENNIPYNAPEYTEWNKLKTEAQVIQAQAGQVIDLGGGATIFVLAPEQSGTTQTKVSNAHDFMVVTKLNYGTDSVLFAGDMEAKLEQKLINKKSDLEAQILKIGHHGSKTSSSDNFLNAVSPEVGIIEAGKDNKYGLPVQLILDRLVKHGIKYYRTDTDGTAELKLDGQNYQILTNI